MQWLKLPAWKVGDRRFKPHSGLQAAKKRNVSSPLTRKHLNIVGNLHDREVACLTSESKGSNFKSCVWRAVSSHLCGGQCHLIHLTILKRFSWPSLAQWPKMCYYYAATLPAYEPQTLLLRWHQAHSQRVAHFSPRRMACVSLLLFD